MAENLRAMCLRARLYEYKEDWINLRRTMLPICQAFTQPNNATSQYDPQFKAEVLLRMYNANRKLGKKNATKQILDAVQADVQLRIYPGIHGVLAAEAQHPQEAMQMMASAVAHEAPWDFANRQKNIDAWLSLQEQMEVQQAQRQEEQIFQDIWGDVIEGCRCRDFSSAPQCWNDWRDAFNIEGGLESDHEEDEEDEEERRHRTGETLATAVQKALENDARQEDTEATALMGIGSNETGFTAVQEKNDLEGVDVVEYVEAVTSVMLTNDVLKWLKNADARFRGLFVKKVERLMRGERSHKLSKGLEGCQSKIL